MTKPAQKSDKPLNEPIDVVAVAVKMKALRCKIVSTGQGTGQGAGVKLNTLLSRR